MKITWIGGATTLLQFHDLKIVCDPVLCKKNTVQDYRYFKSRRLNEPVYDKTTFKKIDILLLTHDHLDHFDDAARNEISAGIAIINSPLVTPKASRQVLLKEYQIFNEKIRSVEVGVTAIPSVHGRNKVIGSLVGKNCGYLIELKKGKDLRTVYITGDDVFKRCDRIVKDSPLDLLIAYAGGATVGSGLLSKILGPITNTRLEVERLADQYKPKKILPVHWGTFSHYHDGQYLKKDFKNKSIVLIKPGTSLEI